MGFLRKVGRKVNKKLKKVFGEKMGSILGMVGLYFAMGAVAKGLSGWAKSTFGSTSSTGAAASSTVEAVGATAEAVGTTAIEQTAAEKIASRSIVDTTTVPTIDIASIDKTSLNSMFDKATTNSDKFNVFAGAQESAIKAGTANPTISTNITDAVITATEDTTLLQQTQAEATANIASLNQEVLNTGLEKSTTSNIAALNPENATTFQKLAADPVGYTVEGIKNATAEGVEYVKSGDFIPDAVQAGATGYVSNVLNPPEEPMFIGGDVMGQPFQEQAQAAHMQTVTPQLAASGLGNVKTFQDLSNQTLYGTGTPNYLQGIYQPLPLPTMLG